jgi:RNA polymerase sigma-70 factor (ECF subfamily)
MPAPSGPAGLLRDRVVAEGAAPRGEGELIATDEGKRDAAWVRATRKGDRAAFGELVHAYQRRVFALAHRYVGDPDQAADLTQRVFLRAFERLPQLTQPERFRSWLFQMTANLAKNQVRYYATKSFQDIDDAGLSGGVDAETALERRDESERLRAAVAALPEKQSACVSLRIDADLSFREIGELVGCSEASARVNYHHGLRALRVALGAAGTAAGESEP